MGLIVFIFVCCLLLFISLRFMKGMAHLDEMEELIRRKASGSREGN